VGEGCPSHVVSSLKSVTFLSPPDNHWKFAKPGSQRSLCFQGFDSRYIEYSNLMTDPLLEGNCANSPARARRFGQFAEQTQERFYIVGNCLMKAKSAMKLIWREKLSGRTIWWLMRKRRSYRCSQ
jgi:hypothetical protein